MMRSLCAAVVLSVPFCAPVARAEGKTAAGPDEVELSHKKAAERRAHWAEEIARLKRAKAREMDRTRSELDEQRKALETVLESGLQRTGDVEYEAVEPDQPGKVVDRIPEKGAETDLWIWEPSEDHFTYFKHDIWTLKPEDFRFWRPTRVQIERPLGARAAAEEKDFVKQTERLVPRDVFMALPFALTNSTDKELLIGPRLWIVSENLRFTQELGGFIAQQDVERSMFRELSSSFDLVGYVKQNPEGGTEPVQAIPPGETRYGVAIFPLPDPELDKMTLVVDGLNNTYRFDRRQKRVLVAEFERPGDEFYPNQRSAQYRGKEWRWMWMWYEELEVAPPPPEFKIPRPASESQDPKTLWAYQVALTNHSGEPQTIKIRQFDTIVRVRALGVEIEVPFVDDGKSTIYKAKVMEEMGQPFSGDRFFSGTIEPDQTKFFPVIFDLEDIAWDRVFEQVERGLTGDISIGYGTEPLKPGLQSFMPDPARLAKVKRFELGDEQKAQVRQEVTAAIADALSKERDRKVITADVSAECGIGSGTFRIVRSYFQKGVIESSWIHEWQEVQ